MSAGFSIIFISQEKRRLHYIDVFTETVNMNNHQIINLFNANAVKLSTIHDQNMR